MSVRIYALAKQLRIESKLLVDLCKQLKLDGKGSALASLTDEEVVLIKAELQKDNLSSKTAREAVENAGAVQTPAERPSVFIQTGKVPVLKPQKPTRPVSSTDNITSVSQTDVKNDLSEISGESDTNLSTSLNVQSQGSDTSASLATDTATDKTGSETTSTSSKSFSTVQSIDASANSSESSKDIFSDKTDTIVTPTSVAPSNDTNANQPTEKVSESKYLTDKATGNIGNIIGNILTDNKQSIVHPTNKSLEIDLQNKSVQETNTSGSEKAISDDLSTLTEDNVISTPSNVSILKEDKFVIDKQRVPSLFPERKNISSSEVKPEGSVSADLSETSSSDSGSEIISSEQPGSSALSSDLSESVVTEQTSVLNSAEQNISVPTGKTTTESSLGISSVTTDSVMEMPESTLLSEAVKVDEVSKVKEQGIVSVSGQPQSQKSGDECGPVSEKTVATNSASTVETDKTIISDQKVNSQENIASGAGLETGTSRLVKPGFSGVSVTVSPSTTGTKPLSPRDRGPKGSSASGQGSNAKAGQSSERRGGSSSGDSGSKNSSRSFSPSQGGKGSRQDSQNSNRSGGNSPLSHIRKTSPTGDGSSKGNQENNGVSTLKSMEDAAAKLPLDNFRNKPLSSVSSNNRIKDLNHLSSNKKQKTGQENDKQRHADVSNRTDNRGSVSVRLVPLPNAPQPKAPKQTREPAPQKPETRFTSIEELKAAAAMEKSGVSPLAGHMQNRNKNKQPKSRKEGAVLPEKIEKPLPEKEDTHFDKTSKKRTDAHFADDEFGNAKVAKKNKIKSELDRSKRRGGGSSIKFMDDDLLDNRPIVKKSLQAKNKAVLSTVPRKGDCVIEMPCTIKQFAETTGVSVASIIKKLMEFGMLATINQPLELDTVELLIEALELKAIIKKEKSLEELFVDSAFDLIDNPESLKVRPPVVTFLGHVDHGKTSLLDRIMHMNVVAGEKGGITQHIRTYRISTKNGDVTFVDTPGHEAFTEMRARGANCTDIAVLVVAADDGVMPQTEEAISHIKAANVPIVVALNKMDLPGVTREKAVQELASNDLMPSEWGGDVEIVETSATTGMGIEKLMDTLLMIAELRELKANPNRPAMGVSLESSMEPGQGVVCKILVQKGTLHPGDIVLCGTAYGKVKAMTDPLNTQKHLKAAGPSTPVTLLGLNTAPNAGSKFVVLEDISIARQIAEQREKIVHDRELSGGEEHVTLESLYERINNAKTQQTLNVIIRADVRGSIEAIRKELSKLEHPEVKVKILQASVGGITEADVHLADASDAIIVGFNAVPDENARSLAEKKKIQVRRYDIIYNLTEDIRAALEGMLKPIEQVKEMGAAVVQQTFVISRIGTIAGCRVVRGIIDRECHCRIIRDRRIIGDYIIETLRREKADAKDVREGYECGIKLKNFNDIKQGDTLEAYKIEKIPQGFNNSGR